MNLADTPNSWADPDPMSTLHALLLFVGSPVLVIAVITLLVMAPSLAKAPRYRPGQNWDADPQAFGALESASGNETRALTDGRPGDESGGASGRW